VCVCVRLGSRRRCSSYCFAKAATVRTDESEHLRKIAKKKRKQGDFLYCSHCATTRATRRAPSPPREDQTCDAYPSRHVTHSLPCRLCTTEKKEGEEKQGETSFVFPAARPLTHPPTPRAVLLTTSATETDSAAQSHRHLGVGAAVAAAASPSQPRRTRL
jgi:hypothetical protein